MSTQFYQEYNSAFFIEHVRRPNSHKMEHGHSHKSFEIYYLFDGDRRFFIHDSVIHLTSGNLVFIHPDILHQSSKGDFSFHERFLIEFKANFLDSYLTAAFKNQLVPSTNEPYRIFHLQGLQRLNLENILRYYSTQSMSQYPKKDDVHTCLFIMTVLNQLRGLTSIKKETITASSLQNRRISDMIKFINTHYTQNIGLDTLASSYGISDEHLSRSFKKVTGLTFSQYLTDLRMKKAIEALKSSKASIASIAKSVGYQSNTHFGRIFQKYCGCSPSGYRKKINPS